MIFPLPLSLKTPLGTGTSVPAHSSANNNAVFHSPEHRQRETVGKEQKKINVRNINHTEVISRFGLQGRRTNFLEVLWVVPFLYLLFFLGS